MPFADPHKNLMALGLQEGQTVADLGAGSGFYTLEAARMVGSGHVYAVDVQADLLARIKNAAYEQHLGNVEVLHGDMERVGGTRIREESIDVALVSNVLFQIENKEDFVKEVARILKSGGRVLVADWSESFGGLGPVPEQVVTENTARGLFKQHGFAEVTVIDAGDHHYGIIFRKD